MDFESLRKDLNGSIIQVDGDGIILSVSPAFEKMFGWSDLQLRGKGLSTIIPEPLRDAHHLGFARFLRTGEKQVMGTPLDLEIVKADGTVVIAEHYIVDGIISGEQRFIARIVMR